MFGNIRAMVCVCVWLCDSVCESACVRAYGDVWAGGAVDPCRVRAHGVCIQVRRSRVDRYARSPKNVTSRARSPTVPPPATGGTVARGPFAHTYRRPPPRASSRSYARACVRACTRVRGVSARSCACLRFERVLEPRRTVLPAAQSSVRKFAEKNHTVVE